jgi:tetratricopeptide (TPR) repeat protein
MAVPPDDLVTQAEAAFHEGVQRVAEAPDQPAEARKSFAQAAKLYEQVRQDGAHNVALYRNLGNASLLAGDLPRAILAYRRGLLLAPNDHELRSNLAFAREEVALPPPGDLGRPPVDHRPPWLPRWPIWAPTLTFAAYALAWLAWVRWRMVRRRGWLLAGSAALALSAFGAAGSAWQAWQDHQEERFPLVVIAEDGVLLRKGNGYSYPPRSDTPLNRGVEARLLFERGPWLQIELSGGEVGWVPRGYVLDSR